MQYIQAPGAIYDTIFYSVLHFIHQHLYSESVSSALNHISPNLLYYREFLEVHQPPAPPADLYPFFYYDGSRANPVINYYHKVFSLDMPFDAFWPTLQEPAFQESVNQYYFRHLASREALDRDMAQARLTCYGEHAPLFADLFLHFEEKRDRLIEYLRQIHPQLLQFHREHDAVSRRIARSLEDLHICHSLQQALPALESALPLQYSVSLLDLYALFYNSRSTAQVELILGQRFAFELPHINNYSHITLESALAVICRPLNRALIALFRGKALAMDGVLAALPSQDPPSVRAALEHLLKERVIMVSARQSGQNIYTLNREYFPFASQAINRYLNSIDLDRVDTLRQTWEESRREANPSKNTEHKETP